MKSGNEEEGFRGKEIQVEIGIEEVLLKNGWGP